MLARRTSWLALLLALTAPAWGCEGVIGDSTDRDRMPTPETPDDDDGDGIPDAVVAAPATLRRLTRSQYRHSVRALTGIEVPVDTALEPDTPSNGFVSVGNARTTISARGVEQYEDAAYAVAAAMAATDPGSRIPCTVGSEGCLENFVRTFGRRAFRRPLTEAEVTRWRAIGEDAATTLGTPNAGIEFVVAGMLQSPNFLFRSELGSGGAATSDTLAEGAHYFDDWEMASRIAFTVCDETPDDALLDAAAAGELTDAESLRGHVERLVASDCARRAVRTLFDEVFGLAELEHVVKDPEVYPLASSTLGPALRDSLLATVERWSFDENRPYDEFFTARDFVVNADVEAVFATDPGYADLGTEGVNEAAAVRSGLLTHPATLARNSHAEATSPTLRGKFVRTALLCQSVPAPPDDVGELPEPNAEARTLRERLESHRTNPACASCHAFLDPIGLALEQFDGVGTFRETENGADIDPSGDLDGVTYDDALGLGQAVSEHPELFGCLVRNLFRSATGRIETAGEERTIALLERDFERDRLLRTLLVELLTSEGFRVAASTDVSAGEGGAR
ncbi:MAG: DUF1588 domain-containing protein [Sandaracinus sp.]|nr:DUF1588 domain-containing protein [Sandaracinus sp.]MCB9624803.1 DUF1588 domain-containing protein [Sandaracinus sp.]